jgi:hypothetical protein
MELEKSKKALEAHLLTAGEEGEGIHPAQWKYVQCHVRSGPEHGAQEI